MKKLLFLTVFIQTSLFVSAQTTAVFTSKISTTANESKIDRPLVAPEYEPIDASVHSRFKKAYPEVVDETWEKSKTGFLVRYTTGGIQHFVYLNKKGGLKSTIRHYSEAELPESIRQDLNAVYGCRPVTGVSEVSTNNKIAYLVTIDQGCCWKTLRFVDGEMDVWRELKKG